MSARTQLLLGDALSLPADAYDYGERSSGETHGVVLTKPHVVELILDLAGYRPEADLARGCLLEPSCGHGVFLTAAVDRLCQSQEVHRSGWAGLEDAIRAYDIDGTSVSLSRAAVVARLRHHGVPGERAGSLSELWVSRGDFLLSDALKRFDYVVGNPPYIRIERLAPALQAAYRSRFSTLYDRADLYVAFIEEGLRRLAKQGTLAYICADRWILNRYGKRLREAITSSYRVDTYVDLHTACPFEADVIAYPSIFAISNATQARAVQVAKLSEATPHECSQLSRRLRSAKDAPHVHRYDQWFAGDEPWVLTSPDRLAFLRSLEKRFATIEEHGGTRVGIGVATGNDSVFIVPADQDIESDRLVPLVMRADLDRGMIRDAGQCVINTFEPGSGPVELGQYPRLADYLHAHEDAVRRRHVSRKNPRSWFRTIDRVYPELVAQPKLLMPDIAGSLQVTFDTGRFFPHHNLYYVVSDEWDLEVLGGLLSSTVAMFFIASYAVRMRGGYLRFQAQYLRRICVPSMEEIGAPVMDGLRSAFRRRDFAALDTLALEAYGVDAVPAFEFVDTRT